ncbi:hypothetical protein HDU85_005130 [Gaertneriomyces sp. JEL0708]|nr:hypothetical protein HDU85_005130 [Gaertneriomyces sp. JEL0708]
MLGGDEEEGLSLAANGTLPSWAEVYLRHLLTPDIPVGIEDLVRDVAFDCGYEIFLSKPVRALWSEFRFTLRHLRSQESFEDFRMQLGNQQWKKYQTTLAALQGAAYPEFRAAVERVQQRAALQGVGFHGISLAVKHGILETACQGLSDAPVGRNPKRRRTASTPTKSTGRPRTPILTSFSGFHSEDDNEDDFADFEPEEVLTGFPPQFTLDTLPKYLRVLQENYDTRFDEAKEANSLLWRHIIDMTPRMISEPRDPMRPEQLLSRDLFAAAEKRIHSLVFRDEWTSIAIRRFLDQLKSMKHTTLISLARNLRMNGYVTTVRCILTESDPTAEPIDSTVSSLVNDADIQYTLEILVLSVKTLAKETMQPASERDFDISYHKISFECLDPLVRIHFGEVESRSSRDRRLQALPASTVQSSKVRGQLVDWLVVHRELETHSAWGIELSAALNVGAMRSQTTKHTDNRKALIVLLRDIHMALARRVIAVKGDSGRAAASQLVVPGVLLNRFRYNLVAIVYLEIGWYGCYEIAAWDAPVTGSPHFPKRLVTHVKNMLKYRNMVKVLIDRLEDLFDPDSSLEELVCDGQAWVSPKAERTKEKR